MRTSSVFDNLPKSCLICALSVIRYMYDITKLGHLSSESGASCLRARFLWGKLSWGELSFFLPIQYRIGVSSYWLSTCSPTSYTVGCAYLIFLGAVFR